MPGAYAHLAVVNVAREQKYLRRAKVPDQAYPMVLKHLKYAELGAVGPDYPYLALLDSGARAWADLMHYTHTGKVIQAAVERLRTMSGPAQEKGLAWLLGFSAHVAMDVSVHPVVQRMVGGYQGHEKEHRICELNQDAWIFRRRMNLDISLAEHLTWGIARCGNPRDPKSLDPDIVDLWSHMLRTAHPEQFRSNPPDFNQWHGGFLFCVDKIAEEGGRLVPLARHVAQSLGLVYPTDQEPIAEAFIVNLPTPGGPMDYGEVFEKAVGDVAEIWRLVVDGVLEGQDQYATVLGEWNLDTGCDANGRLIFWEAAA